MNPVPNPFYNAFHGLERELFTILAINLCRSPTDSMQVIALWLWLERHPLIRSFVHRIREVPCTIINAIAEETASCLDYLQGRPGPVAADDFEIPLLEMLIGTNISLQLFQQFSSVIAEGINDVLITVCGRAFNDIMQQVHQINTAAHQNGPMLSEEDQKTLYMTFSRRRPVPESVLLSYLVLTYGENIIESLVMQEVGANMQPIFCKVVFQNKEIVENILHGRSKVKFVVGGNPVWARKLVPIRQIPI